MDTPVNFDRARKLTNGMVQNGVPNTDAAPLALALEFAASHPEFAIRFGQFSQNNLNRALDSLVKAS